MNNRNDLSRLLAPEILAFVLSSFPFCPTRPPASAVESAGIGYRFKKRAAPGLICIQESGMICGYEYSKARHTHRPQAGLFVTEMEKQISKAQTGFLNWRGDGYKGNILMRFCSFWPAVFSVCSVFIFISPRRPVSFVGR
ncbi:MAG: hypothetical protein PHW56_10230 [Methanosarcinaceae archaeon]|nr:hypothetical protein [Methanosarcinaceae archaeon]